jgi:hypothetical protein
LGLRRRAIQRLFAKRADEKLTTGTKRGRVSLSGARPLPSLGKVEAFRHSSKRASAGLANSVTQGHATLRKWWRRSWSGRVAWPWLRAELEIVAKVAGVVTLSLWLKRLIEQFLGAKVLNESILRGEMNDVVRQIEQDVTERRSRHARRRK